MLFDSHMHTAFSADSEMSFEEVLQKKKELDLGIVTTEHLDLGFPGDEPFTFDADEYFKTYGPYRGLDLLLGVETGLVLNELEGNRKFVRSYPFDQVIGSIHVVAGEDIYLPSYFALFENKDEAFRAYLTAMAENVEASDDFDTLGHIDYITRVAPYEDPYLCYEEHPELLDRILKTLAKKEKALEINTRLFGDVKALTNLATIVRRFAELGGKYATVGSDAHDAGKIGSLIEAGYLFARRCGIQPVVYRERETQLIR